MRKPTRIEWALTLALTCVTTNASAQLDVVPIEPNVLLLVDTSGSMEWKSSGDVDPVCDPTNPNTGVFQTNEKSRWIELQETLTGTINNYSCYAEPRVGAAFQNEFQLSPTDPPYDLGYTDEAYHRPMSNLCAPGPGVMPNPLNPYEYPSGAITYRPFQGAGITLNPGTPCDFSQGDDGLLDSWDRQIRFGLMTFDSFTDPGSGVDSSGAADYASGRRGMWSYFYGQPGASCNGQSLGSAAQCGGIGGGCCLGGPWDCTSPSTFEVGARNAAAPPFEGRMVSFGPPADDGSEADRQIQEILLSTRPYWSTPIAGMLSDARDFLWYDTTPDKLHPGYDFGPSSDPEVQAKCRPEYIILLTDGVPNVDLRPSCKKGGIDKCPYDTPEAIANDLVTNAANAQVRTFVVGFAINQGTAVSADGGTTAVDCATMDLSLCNPMPSDPALAACCSLNNIAFNGTPPALRGKPAVNTPLEDHAFFPKNALELRASLSAIFQKLLSKSTGRTYPVTTSVPLGDPTDSRGFQFTSGTLPSANGVWQGILTRQRITCNTSETPPQVVNDTAASSGDDFVANVNSSPETRTIFSVEPEAVTPTTVRQATWSLRPYLLGTVNDGIGHYKGAQTVYDSASSFSNDLTPESLNVNAVTCGTATAAACSARLLDWAVGLRTASPETRCSPTDCNVIGDIFHSQPVVRTGVPSDSVRDATYSDFAGGLQRRDTMLYASSNDGFFHGFTVAPGDPTASDPKRAVVDSLHNNEQWAFIPPAILPQFVSMYSGVAHSPLNRIPALDGSPVVKDVAVTQVASGTADANYPYLFERQATPDPSQTHTWRTIMVQAYGHNRGGYFALDLTNPTIDPGDPDHTGPKFLWQLTTDDFGRPLFGKGSSTPLITTVYAKTDPSWTGPREVAVAVLPGGLGDAPSNAYCSGGAGTPIPRDTSVTIQSSERDSMPCYNQIGSNSIAARSLTIVRLDTGEIIRTFRSSELVPPQPILFPASVLTDYTFDPTTTSSGHIPLHISAPIVGQPVAYPAETGAVADRIFVGDAEGRLWRVDVSQPDPADWAMNVFFDPYPDNTAGQPVQTAPVLSVDGAGNITVAYSTGDQDNLTPDPPANQVTKNYVVSVSESPEPGSSPRVFRSKGNWEQLFVGGERVLGPLTLFNKTIYYSSFSQGTGSDCSDVGTSKIWAVDYIKPAPGPTDGGLLAPPDASGTPFPQTLTNTIVSGVGLRQLPSCSATTPAPTSSADDFLGYGKMIQSTDMSPGIFQLVFNKGGSTASVPGTLTTSTINLAPPKTPVRINSWAPIIE